MTTGSLHDASWLVTDRTVGASQGAFAFGNMATHVGDDPVAVARNRQAAADRLGAETLVFGSARHSNDVAYVAGPSGDVRGVDALITDVPGVAIAAQGADCVPLGIATRDRWIAAVHCGWRGLVAEVVPSALRARREAGADITGARAHLGPSICPDCYPVGQECHDQVAAVTPEAALGTGSTLAVDVRAGVVAQLSAAGVTASWDRRCTAERADLYSHRRDGRTGRQALLIMVDRS